MISITDDETGQLLQFPDGTDEDVIRAAIARVRAGTHHEHAVGGPDFSDVKSGAESSAPAPKIDLSEAAYRKAKTHPTASLDVNGPDFSGVIGSVSSTAPILPVSDRPLFTPEQERYLDIVTGRRGPYGIVPRQTQQDIVPLDIRAKIDSFKIKNPAPPPLGRSESYWRSVTGSDNPEDWSKYARNAQLGEIEAGGANAMSQAGFADRGMYYENPQTGERYLKHHKSGTMPGPADLDPQFRPGPVSALHDAYAMEGRDFATPEDRAETHEFISGTPARIAGSVTGAVSMPVRAIEGVGAGLRGEIEDLANIGHGGGASSGAGFRRGFAQDWGTNPVGVGADSIQRNIVDPARERLLDASIRAGDSPIAAAGTETGQAALGEVGNPVNWVGPAELVEGLRGAKALSSAAQRAVELEAQGGVRVIEDGSGIVTREFGRGSAPSEIAQQKLARELAAPREPLIYLEDPQRAGYAPGMFGRVKGRLPDAVSDFFDQPWRDYRTNPNASGVALDRPTGPEPQPRNVDRPPLDLPSLKVDKTASDDDVRRIAGYWDYASRRYPKIASRVQELQITPDESSFDFDTGTLRINKDGDLGYMMHELTHAAQQARRWPDFYTATNGGMRVIPRIRQAEPYSIRVEEAYRRAVQPLPKDLTNSELVALRGEPYAGPGTGTVDRLDASGMSGSGSGLVPLSEREYASAFNDESIQPTGGIRSDSEARAYTAWLEKNGMDPDHVERFGESPELEQKFFDLHNPDLEELPPVSAAEQARVDAMSRVTTLPKTEAAGVLREDLGREPTRAEVDAEVNQMTRAAGLGEVYPASNTQFPGRPEHPPNSLDSDSAPSTNYGRGAMDQVQMGPDDIVREAGPGPANSNILSPPLGPRGIPSRPYQNAPDSLLGFRRYGPQAEYGETNFPLEQKVRVTYPNDTWEDAMSGLNKAHAIERAYRNWPGAEIEPIGDPYPRPDLPRRLYASGPPPAPVPPPLTEPEVAKAMGWDVPPGSPRAISDPIRTANFQTNLAVQLGGGPESDRVAQYLVDNSDDVFRKIGPPQSWDTVEDMAARSGTTPEQFLHDNPRWNTLPPEERLRLTYVIKGNEQAIGDLQGKLVAGTASPEEQAELLRRIDTAGDLIKIGAKTGSDYGRALNTLKIEARLALGDDQLLKQRLYRMYADQLDKQKPLMDSLARLDPGNPEELQSFLRSVNKPKFREFIHEYWVNSILATPVPFERKVIGDTLMMLGENGFVRPLSAVWDAARTMGGGAAANAEREVFLRETPAAFVGLGRGVREGFRRGLQVIQRGYDPRLAEGTPLFIPRSAFARAQSPFVRNVVGPVVTMPTRVISAATTMARTMNFTAELYAQAARIASKEELAALKAGATGAFDVSGRIATLVKNPTDDMLTAADRFAGRATFTDQTSAIGQGITRLRDLPGVTSSNPVGNAALETYRAASGFMLPFVHIADRLMVRGFEYTPFNFANAAGQRMAGNYAESAAQAARASIGSMVMAYAASMAMEGRITGAAPKDEGERAAFYGANKQPWSIRTDDGRWVPYGHMQPIAMPLALTAAFYEGWKENPDDDLMGKITDGAVQVGTHITDQSYLLALSKLMDVLHGGEQGRAGRAGSDLAASTTWGLVPYSGLVRTIAKAVDPRVVDARSFSDRLTQNMPVASLGLNGKLDPWGEEVVPAGGRLRTVLASGTALLPTQEHTNPLDQELDRLGMPLGYVGNNVTDHKKKVKLSDDEHFLYQQMAGRASKLLLQELFAREGYMDLDTETQRDEATKAIGAARKFARIVVLRYHNGAENYPGLNPSLGVVNWVNETGTGQGSGPGK